MKARYGRVSFRYTRVYRRPTTVRFKTRSGRRVSFRATRLVRRPARVSFYARRRRRG